MAGKIIENFQKQREEPNQLVMDYAGQGTRRFYSLDSRAYREGALPVKVKELLGLALIFDQILRFEEAIITSLLIWLLVATIFASLVFANLAVILFKKILPNQCRSTDPCANWLTNSNRSDYTLI